MSQYTKDINAMHVNLQRCMSPSARSQFELSPLPLIIKVSQKMEWIKTAQECDISQVMNNPVSISYLWAISNVQNRTNRTSFFICRTDERHVDISYLHATQNSARTTPLYPKFYQPPTAKRQTTPLRVPYIQLRSPAVGVAWNRLTFRQVTCEQVYTCKSNSAKGN